MQDALQHRLTQPTMAIATLGTGLIAITAAGFFSLPQAGGLSAVTVVEGVALITVTVLAYLFPMYIRHHVKICVTSVPLFLMAVLLNPTVAGLTALLAVAGSEVMVQRQRGTEIVDIITQSFRWALTVVCGSLIAHVALPVPDELKRDLPLLVAAGVMWALDITTLPLVLTPVSAERPLRVIRSAVREGGVPEAVQYALGIVGAMLALVHPATLAMLVLPAGLVYLTFRKEMDSDTLHLLESMADNVDLRGSYTNGHSQRVHQLVAGMLDELNMHGQEARQILVAARLHDIGKIGLPDQLLINSSSLTPEERKLIEVYPDRSAEIMGAYPDFARGIEMVRHHHERWDGTGYPHRLTGTDIPFGARIIALADSYDAMTSERPFRRALSPEQAAKILHDGAGRQWDPSLVPAFLNSIGHGDIWNAATLPRAADDAVRAGVLGQVSA